MTIGGIIGLIFGFKIGVKHVRQRRMVDTLVKMQKSNIYNKW